MKLNIKVCSAILFFFSSISVVFSQGPPIPDIFSPTFSHLSGRYNSSLQVSLTSRTPQSDIFYTLDGSKPDSNSTLYIGPISISGNGNYKTITAVTKRNDTLSRVSSATYIIDTTFNPNANYLTNLSFAQYNNYIIGDWFGYSSNPWSNNYCVNLSILPNGNYIDKTTSGAGTYPYNDIFQNVFYYGISNLSPLKTISIYNILASGYANGFVDIVFSGLNTNTNPLRTIKFIDSNNVYIEMWHHNQHGPLTYYLTKHNSLITSIDQDSKKEEPLIYPNPATDYLLINNLGSSVKLINQSGKTYIFSKKEKILIDHLPSGLYFVRFTDKEGFPRTKKLIIQ